MSQGDEKFVERSRDRRRQKEISGLLSQNVLTLHDKADRLRRQLLQMDKRLREIELRVANQS
jgi:hypothetical protein